MDSGRYEKLKARGLTRDSVFQDGRFETLKNILLTAGGVAVIFLNTVDHYDKLVNNGVFKMGGLGIKVSGVPSHCHDNVEELVKKKKYLRHCYGFALSEDGVWREHSWAIKDDETYILETTELRKMYYGIRLN